MLATMTTTPQRLLLAASPMEGHLAPVLAVARALVDRDHHVTVLTSAPFEPRVRASGADFVALPAQADYDDGDLDAAFPERRGRRGLAKLTWDVKHVFVDPMPHQYRALRALVEERAIDAVVAELGFLG